MHLNSVKGKLPINKKTVIFIALVFLGVILSLSFSGEEAAKDEVSLGEYKAELEKELEKLCSSIDGVGKCSVSVSFSRGVENSYKSGKLVETKPPRVLGVAIVCRGADSARVRQSLTELFTSLFDIPSNRVSISKLN